MEFRGVYENGVIRPTEPIDLPDGTQVEFHAVPPNGSTIADSPRKPTPVEELERLSREARSNRSLDEIVAQQGVGPLRSLDDLKIEGLEDEDVDEFLRLVREGRR